MIPRLLAAYRTWDRGFVLPHLLRAARRPADLEPPRTPRWTYGHGAEDALCECRPDGQCEHNGVHLPAVFDPDTAAVPAVVVPAADRQPTAAPSTSDRPQMSMEHGGADEGFADVLAAMRHDLEHDSGGLDPESVAWDEAFAALDRRLADAHMDFVRRWQAVESWCDRRAAGWRSEPRVPAADWGEARKLATGEIPVCTEVAA